MASIKFSKEELERYVKLDEKLIERINMLGTPVESISDNLEIEVNPNRPDLISLNGFVRAIKNFTEKETKLKDYKVNKAEKNYKLIIKKSVKPIRPYSVCAVVKGLNLDNEKIKELINFQEKIHQTLGRNRRKLALGVYPLEKIKMPIVYEALSPKEIKFIPLDSDKELDGNQILEKHPKGREYAELLKGYNKFPVFIDANKKILSMPPIINSQETGKIDLHTKDIFIECSGNDLNLLKKTLNILTTSLADLGGKIYQMRIEDEIQMHTPDLSYKKMKLSLNKTNKVLGLNLTEKEVSSLLKKMGHSYKKEAVLVPPWRVDILHEIDLIEEVAIAYGYENFYPQIPNISSIGKESKESRIKSAISEVLIGLELLEATTFHLIKLEEAKEMKIKSPISLANSKTEYKVLRPNLFIPLLRVLSENTDREYPHKIFEIGRVFNKDPSTETGIKESDNLIIGISPGNFTEIKQILDYIFNNLNLEYKLEEHKMDNLIEGRIGNIIINTETIGHIGEVHPNILKQWHLKMPLSILEINLSSIYDFFNLE